MLISVDVLSAVTQACSDMTNAKSASVYSIGQTITTSLLIAYIAWEGTLIALRSASGRGLDGERIANCLLLIGFVWSFEYYYWSDSWLSPRYVINETSKELVTAIGTDNINDLTTLFGNMVSTLQAPQITLTSLAISGGMFLHLMMYGMAFISMLLFQVCVTGVVAYGAIASAVVAMLGPIFIPWLIFKKTDWLFWGWLKAYLGFQFYSVVAAALLRILYVIYAAETFNSWDLLNPAFYWSRLVLLLTSIYMILKVPSIASSLFSGGVGGHSDLGSDAASTAARAYLRKGV